MLGYTSGLLNRLNKNHSIKEGTVLRALAQRRDRISTVFNL